MCCANAGFSPRRGAEANDESEALAQVAHGAGVALVSKAVPAGREVVFRQLVERPRVTIAAAWRASDDRPELTELVQHLGLFGETRSRRSSR
jgi:DNA-binding transcriptional LysR family regulator